jgi:hypothetical protein
MPQGGRAALHNTVPRLPLAISRKQNSIYYIRARCPLPHIMRQVKTLFLTAD